MEIRLHFTHAMHDSWFMTIIVHNSSRYNKLTLCTNIHNSSRYSKLTFCTNITRKAVHTLTVVAIETLPASSSVETRSAVACICVCQTEDGGHCSIRSIIVTYTGTHAHLCTSHVIINIKTLTDSK